MVVYLPDELPKERAGLKLKPPAQHMQAVSTSSTHRLRANYASPLERTSTN